MLKLFSKLFLLFLSLIHLKYFRTFLFTLSGKMILFKKILKL